MKPGGGKQKGGEHWATIPDFPAYQISNHGRLLLKAAWDDPPRNGRNIQGLRVDGNAKTRRKTRVSLSNSNNVCLRNGGVDHWFKRAQLILMTFVGPRPSQRHVARHLDDNPKNNVVDNLAWGTQKDNYADAVRNGRSGHGSPAARTSGDKLRGRPRTESVRLKISATKRAYPKRQYYWGKGVRK